MLCPRQLFVISDYDCTLTLITDGFHTALRKDIYALAIIARPPRGICVKVIKFRWLRKCIETVVQDGIKMLDPFFVSKPLYGLYNPLIKVEHSHTRRSKINDPASLEIGHAYADGVAVANKG